MYELLQTHIAKYVDLRKEDFEYCSKFFIPKKVRKKSFLLQEGDVCKYLTFVNKGILRSYTVDKKGTEHVVQFAFEGWWIADPYSFVTGEAGTYYIDALEDSEVLQIDKVSFEKICDTIPRFERMFRLLLQNNFVAIHRRISNSLSLSAEEQYLELTNHCPNITNRIPQRHIASFLGITPEALSRIRKKISTKK